MAADLVVGIDIGMSGTGVAFSTREGDVKSLYWKNGNSKEEKIPTTLFYGLYNPLGEPLGWGFGVLGGCTDNIRTEEWFKVSLGDKSVDQLHVERCYRDYLTCLCKSLSERFTTEQLNGKHWTSATIRFHFSSPATWTPEVVDRFRNLASEAGFDSCDGHTIIVSLTEPQSVAAYAICQKEFDVEYNLLDGKSVLIVDAGGGTGDFCLLEVEDDAHGNSRAIELQPVIGQKIGSTYIDTGFQTLAETFLKPLEPILSQKAEDIAWALRNTGEFQEFKHKFTPSLPFDCLISIPHLRDPQDKKTFQLERKELQRLFDNQIELLETYIADIVAKLVGWTEAIPNRRLDYVMLSGGLGCSPYVRQRIEQFCASSPLSLLRTAKVVESGQPRLSVCMGIVYHATRNPAIFQSYCCRASFGVACKVSCSDSVDTRWKSIQGRARDESQRIVKDQFNKKWFDNCIDWFIKKGATVTESGIITYHHSSMFPADVLPSKRICEVKILSTFEENPSPFEDRGWDGAHTHTSMRVDLSRVGDSDIQSKNSGWHKKILGKKPYVRIEFLIEAQIGLAEVKFQCYDLKRSVRLSQPILIGTKDEKEALLPIYQGLAELAG